MRRFAILLLIVLTAGLTPQRVAAEPKVSLPLGYIESEPDKIVAEAFSAPYGRLLVAEFTSSFSEGTFGDCVRSKRMEPSAFADSVHALVVRHGAQMIRNQAAAIDRPAFKTNFATLAGADAEAELVRLRDDPNVRTFLEIGAPLRHAATVNIVIEMVDRYLLIQRIKIRRFNPIATGNEELLKADPSEAILDRLDDFMQKIRSSALNRYLELSQMAQQALDQSIDTKMLLSYRIVDLFPGLDKDLANICFPVR